MQFTPFYHLSHIGRNTVFLCHPSLSPLLIGHNRGPVPKSEICTVIQFLTPENVPGYEIHCHLCAAYKNLNIVTKSTVNCSVKSFKEGWMSTDEKVCSSSPPGSVNDETIAIMHVLSEENWWQTVHNIEWTVNFITIFWFLYAAHKWQWISYPGTFSSARNWMMAHISDLGTDVGTIAVFFHSHNTEYWTILHQTWYTR